MSTILDEPWAEGLQIRFVLEEILDRRRSEHQELIVAQTETYGRALFIDDLLQSTEADEAMYHEPLVHPAMIIHGAARRVLVGGAGEGASLRELLRHPTVEEVLAVDLDPTIVEACREHLPSWSDGAFEDPRVTLRIEDVQATLARDSEPYDVVLLDVTDPVEDGPAVDLFTVRFFERVAARLHDDGIVVLQSGELDPYDLGFARTVQTTLRQVFPWNLPMVIHVPSFHCIWSITLAGKRAHDPVPADLEDRVARLPAERLRAYSAGIHRALVTAPPWVERGLAVPGTVLSGEDERRLVTFRKDEGP